MVDSNKEYLFKSYLLVIPLVIGALLSGYFYLTENLPIPLTMFQLFFLVAGFGFILNKVLSYDFRIEIVGIEKELLLFLAIIFFSLLYSPERGQGLFYVLRYCALIITSYLIYNSITDYKQLRIVCYVIIITSVILSFINVVNMFLNPEVLAFNYVNQGEKIIRSSGGDTDPNIFASNFFLSILLLVGLIGDEKKFKRRILLFCALCLIVLSVLLSYSRSSWVSIFIAGFILLLVQKKIYVFKYSFFLIGVVFVGSDSVRNLVLSVGDRILDIFAGSSDDSSRLRIVLLQTALIMWVDSYTFGVGYQGFSTFFKKYHPPQSTAGVYEPHNEYYAVLSELGTFGFLLFIYILFKLLRLGWNRILVLKESNPEIGFHIGIYASFIAYLIFFQFLGGMQQHTLYMINLGLLFAVLKIDTNNYKSEL